jgi:hypothetical protein
VHVYLLQRRAIAGGINQKHPPTTTNLPPLGANQTSAEHSDISHSPPNSVLSHTNEPSTEEPPVNPPTNVEEEGNSEQSAGEPPVDPPASVGEEGKSEQSAGEPPVDPPVGVGEAGKSEQSAGEPPLDPPTNVGEEGNVSGPSRPVRNPPPPHLSENVADCIGYANEEYIAITYLLDTI